MTLYFTYVHARPTTRDASGIFYVGKGAAARVSKVARANAHHRNIVSKYGQDNILVGKFDCSSEQIALDLEVGLIRCLKRMGVRLANKTDGGEGVSGFRHSEDTKTAMSRTHMTRYLVPGVREKTALQARESHSRAEVKAKISSAASKMWESVAHRERHSQKMKELFSDVDYSGRHSSKMLEVFKRPELREKLRIAAVKSNADPIRKQKACESAKNLWQNPEYRAKCSSAISKGVSGSKWLTSPENDRITRAKGDKVAELLAQGWSFGKRTKTKGKR